jgi:hypothetical protein
MVALNSNNVPPEHILEWCRNLVRTLHDGGVWGIPRSQTVFRVDKQQQRLVLISAGSDNDADFFATQEVFAHIGWDVVKNDDA